LRAVPLRLYGQVSDLDRLEWDEIAARLVEAGTYWVTAAVESGPPHPRPVWGCWIDDRLLLSIGSPVVLRQLASRPDVTVHLDSGTEPVIVEGRATAVDRDDTETLAAFLAAYNPKYDWAYDVDELGPPTLVTPDRVLAWRSAGWAGRESFTAVGQWLFP
jgi:hypothetical protein